MKIFLFCLICYGIIALVSMTVVIWLIIKAPRGKEIEGIGFVEEK